MEKISVIDFITKYKTKDIDIKDIIIRYYCPIVEKRVVLEALISKAVAIPEDGIIYIDLITKKVNEAIALLSLYTSLDLTPEKNENATAFDIYDFLQELCLVEEILTTLPVDEYQEFYEVRDLIVEMLERRLMSTEACINRIVKVFGETIGNKMSEEINKLSDALSDEEKVERFVQFVKN